MNRRYPEERGLRSTGKNAYLLFIGFVFLEAEMAYSFAEKYVRDLAVAIRKVVLESLWGIRKDRLAPQLLAIGERCASLPDIDHRNADEILGYDEQGLPQ